MADVVLNLRGGALRPSQLSRPSLGSNLFQDGVENKGKQYTIPLTPAHSHINNGFRDALSGAKGRLSAAEWPCLPEGFPCPAARSQSNAMVRLAILSLVGISAHVLRLLFPSVSSLEVFTALAFLTYAAATELYRLAPAQRQIQALLVKNRKLVEARRAAGLLRLEQVRGVSPPPAALAPPLNPLPLRLAVA